MRTVRRPTEHVAQYVQIVRPQMGQPINGVILADDLLLYCIHRDTTGRTLPCPGEGCPFCSASYPMEERLFLPLWSNKVRLLRLLDLPASHWPQLVDTWVRYGALTKFGIRATREKRWNGPIRLAIVDLPPGYVVPDERPDVDALLLAITRSNVAKALLALGSRKNGSSDSPLLNDLN